MLHAVQTMTTGEWCVKTEAHPNDLAVARIYNTTNDAEKMANLFAAAPDLLLALKRAANAIAAASSHVPSTMNKQMELAWSTAQAAIAKADVLK